MNGNLIRKYSFMRSWQNKQTDTQKQICTYHLLLRALQFTEFDCAALLRLVHTSDGVGSGDGIGSVRSVPIQCKSKNGIGSGVGSSTESESEGSDEFLFLPIPLPLPSLPIQ